jgi:hypothetical protein
VSYTGKAQILVIILFFLLTIFWDVVQMTMEHGSFGEVIVFSVLKNGCLAWAAIFVFVLPYIARPI